MNQWLKTVPLISTHYGKHTPIQTPYVTHTHTWHKQTLQNGNINKQATVNWCSACLTCTKPEFSRHHYGSLVWQCSEMGERIRKGEARQGWRGGSVVKGTCCSRRGSRLGSNPHRAAYNNLWHELQDSRVLAWPLWVLHMQAQAYMQAKHIQKVKMNKS